MRRFDAHPADMEFPSLYFLDEPRFSGGKEILRNMEDKNHGQNSRKHG